MLRNQAIKQAEEWISLSGSPSPPSISEMDVKRDPDYSFYPYPIIYPDMLPPDYPAIISLLFSVIAICFNVQHFLELYIYSGDKQRGWELYFFLVALLI